MDDVVQDRKMMSGVTAGEDTSSEIDEVGEGKGFTEMLRAHERVHGGDTAGAGAVS